MTFRLINQLLHLSAAGVVVGSAIFMRAVMIPRLEAQGATTAQILYVVDRFYSIFPWIALAIFFTTGLFNYIFWLALIVKVLLAHVLVGLAIALGLVRAMQEDAEIWLLVLIGVGALIVAISAGLRRSAPADAASPRADGSGLTASLGSGDPTRALPGLPNHHV